MKSLDQLKRMVEAESEYRNYRMELQAIYTFLIEETNDHKLASEFITSPKHGGYTKSEFSTMLASMKYSKKQYYKNKAYNQVQAF